MGVDVCCRKDPSGTVKLFMAPPVCPFRSFWFSTHFVAWEALLDATEQESRTRSEVCQELLQSVSQQLSDLMTKKKQLIKRVSQTKNTFSCILERR